MGKIVNPQIIIVKGGDTPTPPTTGDYFVKVIDFDGTILKSANLNNGDTFELPTPPSHDGLVFQEWSSSQAITDNKITINNNNVMIGAVYTTASGLSEFDIELTTVTGLSVTLNMDGTKNWGDGTSDTETTHTYSAVGNYTITCDGTTMTTSTSSGLFGQSNSTPNYILTKVRLSSGVTSIGGSAFSRCYSLTNITIPNSVTYIAGNDFEYCYSLTNVVIPSGVTYIGSSAFYDSSLTNVVIPSGVTSISSSAFGYCYSLTNVAIPSGVTSIGSYSFQACSSLTNVVIPSGVTSIDNSVFNSCSSLKNVVIPSSVTSIRGAFGYCHSLTNVAIPNSVTSIGSRAFYQCYSLTNVAIPSGVTSIGGSAFYWCYSLLEYDFSTFTSVPTLSDTNVFTGINGICKMKIPSALIDEWKTATNWATYADYMVAV